MPIMADWHIRQASATDMEAVAELRAVVMRPDLERLGRYDPHRVRQRLRDGFDPAHTWIIETNTTFAGCVALRPSAEAHWLEHFYLAQDVQGTGIGTGVLRELLERTDEDGVLVRLNVLQGSPARRLYERLGFTVESEDPVDVFMVRKPPGGLHFRLADETDLPTLVRLRDDAARWMLARGVTNQWRPGQLGEDHFRRTMASGEVWLAESDGRVTGAWELWWEDEDAWGPQPPVAGYVHRLMVDRGNARPGTGRSLLRAAERRVAEAGRTFVRLDCLADNARLNAYYLDAGYRVVGHKAGKPQPGGAPKSFTLLEKACA